MTLAYPVDCPAGSLSHNDGEIAPTSGASCHFFWQTCDAAPLGNRKYQKCCSIGNQPDRQGLTVFIAAAVDDIVPKLYQATGGGGCVFLVTPRRPGLQQSRHEWGILQPDQSLARLRNLVTLTACWVWRGYSRDGQRARPAHERHAPGRASSLCSGVGPTKRPDWRPHSRGGIQWLGRSVEAHGCDGRDQKRPRSTSTYAVQTAP